MAETGTSSPEPWRDEAATIATNLEKVMHLLEIPVAEDKKLSKV